MIGREHVVVIAELGINHNGDMSIAREMIDAAAEAGCDAVKTQARTLNRVYTPEEMAKSRPGPWGATNGDLKRWLELDRDQHGSLMSYARAKGLQYGASPWDLDSCQMLVDLKVDFLKLASPRIGHIGLCQAMAKSGIYVVMSTGMASLPEVIKALHLCKPQVLMHCVSEYPGKTFRTFRAERIRQLAELDGAIFGYSGHEAGMGFTLRAVDMGALVVERHLTLDRKMWGSDHSSSMEPDELKRLVTEIRMLEPYEAADPGEEKVHPVEMATRDKLWRTQDL